MKEKGLSLVHSMEIASCEVVNWPVEDNVKGDEGVRSWEPRLGIFIYACPTRL